MTSLAFRGERMDSKALALSVNTNPVVVRRLLLALRRAKLIKTSAGRTGGASLAKPVRRITLLEIYDAVQPPDVISINQRQAWRRCPVSCNIRPAMTNVATTVEQAVRRTLGGIPLQQLIRQIQRKQRD